ncbi:nodulation protein NfeD, partial [Thermodesulfovibrionales bacterium]|nr:nodulation protein NfeD [Thermodesulfovibrionales bacterium]
GLISFILGSIMAFPSPYPFLRVSLEVVIPVAIVTAIFFVFTGTLALQAYRRRPITGIEGLKGREGVASTDITPTGGMVSVGGETWSAYSDDVIPKKTKVVVEEFKGLKVKVRRESPKKTL